MGDLEEYDEREFDTAATCPRCDGWGHIDCNCGGDLCVCANYGERECPVCGGEGSVSDARYEQYQAAQRKWWSEYQAALTTRQRRSAIAQKPEPTTKRAKVKAARKQRQRHG